MDIHQKKVMLVTVFSLLLAGSLNWQGAFAGEASSSSDASKLSPVEVRITGSNISADLKNVSLKTVLDKLQKEYGLQYKAAEDLLQREVSVKFKDMPLEEGIRKIVSPLNSLIVYDEKSKAKRLYVVDVSQGEKVGLKGATALQTSPSAEAFKDYKPLPFADFKPAQITSGPFVEPGPDYKPLPQFTPVEVTSGPFATPGPEYKPLPQFTPVEITSGPFVEPGPEYKPLPPYDPDANKPKASGSTENK